MHAVALSGALRIDLGFGLGVATPVRALGALVGPGFVRADVPPGRAAWADRIVADGKPLDGVQ